MTCKEAQFDVVKLYLKNQFKAFSINLNAQNVTGMTPLDSGKLVERHVWLLDTLE